MSGARPIKMPYTTDQVMFAGFSDSTNGNQLIQNYNVKVNNNNG